MKAWSRIASGCILALAAAGCGGGDTSQSSTSVRGDLISEVEAIAIAQAEVPGGAFVRAELDLADDDEAEPRWELEFYVAADDAIIQVEVHAVTGEVLEIKVEGDEDDD